MKTCSFHPLTFDESKHRLFACLLATAEEKV